MDNLKKIPLDYRKLESALDDKEFKKEFLILCQTVVRIVHSGKASLHDGAYTIAGMMFMDRVSADEIMEDICFQAGELELPPHQVSGNIVEKWAELKESLVKLSSSS